MAENLAPDLVAAGLTLCRSCTAIDEDGAYTVGCQRCNYSGREELWRLVVSWPGAGMWHDIWLESGNPGSWNRAAEFRLLGAQADDLLRSLAHRPEWICVDRRAGQ